MMKHTDKDAEDNESGEKSWNPLKTLFAMRREAPEFRRCCFCVPLRRGVIGWGYAKVALDVLAMCLMVFIMSFIGPAAGPIVEMVLLLIDVIFNVLLIVGGHLKNIKILKVTYIYSMVWLGLALLGFCWLAYMDISLAVRMISRDAHYTFILAITLPGFCVQFAIFFMQIYWVFLLRSLVAKLQDQTVDFQFTNPSTADAQCTLHKHNMSPAEPQRTLHKHNMSPAEPQRTLHKHNMSPAEPQRTLHKNNPSSAEENPVTNTSEGKPNIDTTVDFASSKYTKL